MTWPCEEELEKKYSSTSVNADCAPLEFLSFQDNLDSASYLF